MFSHTEVLSQGAHMTIAGMNGEWEWYNTVGSTACLRKLSSKNGAPLSMKNKNNLFAINITELEKLTTLGGVFVTVGNVPN